MAGLPIHILAKPVGATCNLACTYCFYSDKTDVVGPPVRMSESVLRAWITQAFAGWEGAEVPFLWQGGEPTAAGLGFYERAFALQQELGDGRPVSNHVQTNGMLVDADWAALFADHDVLVGLSIDGPRALHDSVRQDRKGQGSFDRVMAGFEVLAKAGVRCNTLTTVGAHNAHAPREVYRFLRDLGHGHLQFIPLVECVGPGGDLASPGALGGTLTPFSVGASAWGTFLTEVFAAWLAQDVGRVHVRTFESALGAWCGQAPTVCVLGPDCSAALVLEANGDVFCCDHYVYPEHRLGNVGERSLRSMHRSPAMRRFAAAKTAEASAECRACPWWTACHGDCPKHRIVRTPSGEPISHLCEGYRRFFATADPWLRSMRDALQEGRPAASVSQKPPPRAARNAPCPCGSGRRTKRCCG
jgi:uncharacterized protein